MEARIAKLESDVDYIKRDVAELKTDAKELRKEIKDEFRITWGALFIVALGLASMMAKGFGWL